MVCRRSPTLVAIIITGAAILYSALPGCERQKKPVVDEAPVTKPTGSGATTPNTQPDTASKSTATNESGSFASSSKKASEFSGRVLARSDVARQPEVPYSSGLILTFDIADLKMLEASIGQPISVDSPGQYFVLSESVMSIAASSATLNIDGSFTVSRPTDGDLILALCNLGASHPNARSVPGRIYGLVRIPMSSNVRELIYEGESRRVFQRPLRGS